MKSPEKPKRYELIPFRMVIPGIPLVADGGLPSGPSEEDGGFHAPEEIPIRGVSTVECCADRAKREADELLRRCRRDLRCGDRSAILDLLDLNPEFICVAWVQAELLRLLQGGLPLRKRGRPKGRYNLHPLVVVGLVEHLIATGRARNREQAFGKLEELQVLPYESAKDAFYQVVGEKRFRPVLVEFPELAREVSAEEESAWRERVEVLGPGRKITRTWTHPQLGTVETTFKARPSGHAS